MNKSRILVVDDDPNISRLVATILSQSSQYEVRTENRAYAALASARDFKPDLVLLDVDMPGKDGGEVASEIHGDPALAHVPIVFLTSLVSRNEAGNGLSLRGGMRFLAKPVDPAVLQRSVRSLLAVAA